MTATAAGAIDPGLFRETLGHYPTGVAVVTGIDASGSPVGMVVGTFSSISLEPPLVSFSPQKSSRTFAALRECATFCVNVLASDQEDVCRLIASGGPDKFSAVGWTAAPGGAPVLDDVVAWVECAWDQVIEAGDHYIVLGAVRDLGVPRAVAPLLFFQGGYGKFSSPSLMAGASPDLLEAVRLAEAIRSDVEQCSAEVGATCAVLAKVASEIVTVLVADSATQPEGSTVGQRAPHIAPLGAAFLNRASEDEVADWIAHLEGSDDATLQQLRDNLETVRERGYSIALHSPASDERRGAMADYSAPDSLPSHARRIRGLIAASVQDYEPTIDAEGTYDLYSVTVPVPDVVGGPLLCIRLTGLPQGADGRTVQRWIAAVTACAERAVARLEPADELD